VLSKFFAGKRSDLLAVKRALDDGSSFAAIASDHFSSFIRYGRAFKEYKRVRQAPRSTKTIVCCFYGPSGIGKSRFATAFAGYLGSVYKVPQPKGSGLYWDDYDGQSVVFIDEMDGNYMTPTFFNTLCDRYECVVPVHGGAGHQMLAKYIIICSNYHPRYWWKKRSAVQLTQTMRRMEICIPFVTSYWQRISLPPEERALVELRARATRENWPLGVSRLLNLNNKF